MRQRRLLVELDKAALKQMAVRYHFEEKDLPGIDALYKAVFPLVKAQACFLLRGKDRALCAVTLGEGPDELQEVYNRHEAVWEAYVTECVGNMLLEKAYEKLADVLLEETGSVVEGYEFPGSQGPVSDVGKILAEMTENCPQDREGFLVQANEAFALRPKKSAVFVCMLGKEKKGRSVCEGCPRTDCDHRAKRDREGYDTAILR